VVFFGCFGCLGRRGEKNFFSRKEISYLKKRERERKTFFFVEKGSSSGFTGASAFVALLLAALFFCPFLSCQRARLKRRSREKEKEEGQDSSKRV
jgi:hypothetical protein